MTGNLAHLPHAVTPASYAEGRAIEGKLSNFKTPETAHLWRDDYIESPKKEKERKAVERKTDVVRHNRIIPPLIEEDVYKSAREAVEVVGGHVSTIRDWIKKGELKDVKKVYKNGRLRFEVSMKELTELVRKKRDVQADGTQTWEQKNRAARRAYSLAYYHKNKKLKFIREAKSENT